jgi:hypothetical protein
VKIFYPSLGLDDEAPFWELTGALQALGDGTESSTR